MRRYPLLWILTLCAALSGLPVLATAENWQPELVDPGSGGWPADSIFTVTIAGSLAAAEQEALAMELDGIDLSGILEFNRNAAGTVVSAAPPQPLESGAHELRLLRYTDDGEIIELGNWSVVVHPGQGQGERAAGFPANLELGYLVDEDELSDSGSRYAANGDIGLKTHASAGIWRFRGDAEMLVQTDRDELAADISASEGGEDLFALQPGNDIELGEYLFSGERPGLNAMVGHHEMDGDNLLVSDFHRRGVSVNGEAGAGRLNSSLFAFRTEPVIGWRHGLGVGDAENRVLGAMATMRPFATEPGRLAIRAMVLRGEGADDTGIGIAGSGRRGQGDGVSLGIESRLAADRLRLLGEVAETDFSSDATAEAGDGEKENAGRILAEVVPWRDDARQRFLSLGVEYQRVDERFHSLANPTLPGDREMRRIYSDIVAGPLTLRAQYARENDNIDDEPGLSTNENRVRELLLSYTPVAAVEGELPWYGRPSVTAGVRYTRSRVDADTRQDLGQPSSAIPGDRETPYYHTEFALQHERWGINVGFADGDEEDLITGALSSGSRSRSLGFHWFPGDRLFLFGQIQTDRFDSGAGLPVLDSDIALLSAEIALLPDRFSLVLDASVNRSRDDGDLIDEETRTWGLGIDWQPTGSALRRAGTTFWVRAEEQRIRDRVDPSLDYDPWQVMAGIRLSLPGGSTD